MPNPYRSRSVPRVSIAQLNRPRVSTVTCVCNHVPDLPLKFPPSSTRLLDQLTPTICFQDSHGLVTNPLYQIQTNQLHIRLYASVIVISMNAKYAIRIKSKCQTTIAIQKGRAPFPLNRTKFADVRKIEHSSTGRSVNGLMDLIHHQKRSRQNEDGIYRPW